MPWRAIPAHFSAEIFELKPHRGTRRAAAWIRESLAGAPPAAAARLQDRYSIRCAPHVIGVLLDALDFSRELLEIEINGVDDNPIIDPESGEVFHGGNFYGGHVAFVMDSLKAAVASVADLLDRQLLLLCAPETSGGLPANLIHGASNHGFKAMQISTSALTAEALKLTLPAASFSRSTESHNQDKVSMGTLAARDALRVVELTETVAAIGLLAGCQGAELRAAPLPQRLAVLLAAVRAEVPAVHEDRRQDLDIARVLTLLRSGALPIERSSDGARREEPAHQPVGRASGVAAKAPGAHAELEREQHARSPGTRTRRSTRPTPVANPTTPAGLPPGRWSRRTRTRRR